MKIHLIAIGGNAMHNLALALHQKGYKVSGSDDEIFEPSRTRLGKHGLLPAQIGWFPDRITSDIDTVILGMHARNDNPELIKAQKLGLTIYSYPEYLFEQTKNKKRCVIAGSHGKTTITSMIMHVFKHCGLSFDYMVGAIVDEFDTMIRLSDDAPVAIFEGDEYLSSALDKRPKFHLYHPHIALISGIAWDHINVFPTFENYQEQFAKFIELIEPNGTLYYYEKDSVLKKLIRNTSNSISKVPYQEHPHTIHEHQTYLLTQTGSYKLNVFGNHNLQNINGAKMICNQLGVADIDFYKAISSFKGASKRLHVIKSTPQSIVFLDFAHAPSKVNATISALRDQYPERKLIACLELHTFSSLNKDFLDQYNNTMDAANECIVYFNPKTLKNKHLPDISVDQVKKAFGNEDLNVFVDIPELIKFLKSLHYKNSNFLFMSSGNFDEMDLPALAKSLIE